MANAQQNTALPGQAALHGRASYSSANPDGGTSGLMVAEIKHLGKLNIRGGKALAAGIKAHTGCNFPPAANSVNSAGARHLVWLGPDEALLLCEAGKEEELQRLLKAEFAGTHHAVTNVTDGLCALQLDGAAVRQVLAKGCALDLHPSAFVTGQCAQTMVSHAGVTLIAIDADSFLLICRTSFAPYMVDWLQDAALEYGVTVSA